MEKGEGREGTRKRRGKWRWDKGMEEEEEEERSNGAEGDKIERDIEGYKSGEG